MLRLSTDLHDYTPKRGSFRWPESIFYTLLDRIGANAFTIFVDCFCNWKKNNPNRRKLSLRDLALCLVKPYVSQRNTSSLHKDIVFGINCILCEKTSSTDSLSSSSSMATTTRVTSHSMVASRGQ